MAAPTAPTPTPNRDAPRAPMSNGRLVALGAIALAAVVVAAWTPAPSGADEEVGTMLTTGLYVAAVAAGLPVVVSLMNRRAARPSGRERTVTFRRPGGNDGARPAPSVRPLVAIAAVAAVAFGAAYVGNEMSRNLTEAFCSDSVDPDTCANDAGFPLAVVGAACALVFLGCAGAALVVQVRRRRSRPHAGPPPPP